MTAIINLNSLWSQTTSNCCSYEFTDLGNFPSSVGGVNIKIGKQKTACGAAQDQSFKLVLTNNTDYKVEVSGYFYAMTTCGQKFGTKFLKEEIGPHGKISGNDIFIWDMTGLTFGVSMLDCKGIPVGCNRNNLIEKMGVEDIKVEYPQFEEARKQNQATSVWNNVPYYRINSSDVEMKIGKQKAGNGEFQKFWLYVSNNSNKKIRISGIFYAASICGNIHEFPIEIDLNPGDILQGTKDHLSDPNGLTGYLENGNCNTYQLGNQIENDIISYTDVKNIKISYIENEIEEITTPTDNNNTTNTSEIVKPADEQPKKEEQSKSDNSNGYNNYYPPDRRVQFKEASDALTATSFASFATMGAFVLANDYGYTTYEKDKMAFNLSLGLVFNQIPVLTTQSSDLDPSYTDFDHGGGTGFVINSEYWIKRGPKGGLAGFYNCDMTSFSMVGSINAQSYGMSGNYGLKSIYGKQNMKLYGELSFGKRSAGSESSFFLNSFPNVYEFKDYSEAKYSFQRYGYGIFIDLSKAADIDKEVSVGISYLTDKITGIENTIYKSFGEKGKIVLIDFKMAMFNLYFEIGSTKYPSVGIVNYPYNFKSDRSSYYKIGILTGLTVFSTK